jgi:tetratricopeptide (TPR) repeat protein
VLNSRVDVSTRSGRPMSPAEVDRLVALKALHRSGRALSVARLLGMDASVFFSGSAVDIESRYAQAWALCLLAIRDGSVGQMLAQAIEARLAKKPRADIEADLGRRVSRFILDTSRVPVTKETAWKEAEKIYSIDPIFAGLFYTWIHVIDPGDMKALVYLGDALFKGGNLDRAMRYYLDAKQLDGRSALPLLRMGDVYSHIGEYEAALRAWHDAAVTTGSGDDEALYRQLAKERPAEPRPQ